MDVETPTDVATPVDAAASRSAIITVVVLCFGGLCATLTQTIVIPIQAELPLFLHTSAANASWVVTATLVTGAVSMPVAGRLGDLFGKQRVLVACTMLLLVGSLLCAMSHSLTPMVAGRVLQGMALGYIPVGISLMREVTPPAITPTAIAAMSATLGVGGSIGLPLSAYIAQDFDWHALFWTSVGLAAVVTLLLVVLVPHTRAAGVRRRFDAVGALGLAAGLVAVLIGVSKGNEWGWAAPRVVGCLVGGLVILLAWGWFELRQGEPLCDLRVSAQRPVLLTNIASITIGFGMMAQAIVVPQLLQLPTATGYGLGQSLLATGLWMAPGGLMMLFFAPVSSSVISRLGAKRALMIGGAFLGGGYLLAVFLMSAPWQLLLASIVSSAGVGISYAAMPTLVMNSVPARESGSAVGINGLMRSIGTSVASAVMVAVLTGSTQAFAGRRVPTHAAFQLCFVVGTVAALAGVAIAAFIPIARRPAGGSPVSARAPIGSPRALNSLTSEGI